ncbi:MAG: GNAT family N-acetyltransferase [Pseudomonadota bacterium]
MDIKTTNDPAMAPAFAHLGAISFTQTFGHLYREKDLRAYLETSHKTEEYARMLSDPAFCLWLVRDDRGEAVGYGVCGPTDLPIPNQPPGSGELWRLYLLEQAQGRGIGAQLLGQCLTWLKSHFDHVFLSVYAENYRAQKLYARHGFEKVHDYQYMVGNHADPEWIMRLRGD